MASTTTKRTVKTFDAEGHLQTTQEVTETIETSGSLISEFIDNFRALPPHLQRAIQKNPSTKPTGEGSVLPSDLLKPKTEAEVVERKAEQSAGAKPEPSAPLP